MSRQLFVINCEDGVCGFYSNLQKAKDELKNIYNKTCDFKYFDYKIIVYNLLDDEYIITNVSYKYSFDTFFS